MTAQTVATEGGRIRVPDLPDLGAPQAGDTVLGVQDGRAGRFPVSALGGGSPDLSSYARSSDLQTETQAREKADTELKNKIDGLNIPSTDGLAKNSDLETETQEREKADRQLEEKINALDIPSISGLAKSSDLKTEAEAREQGDRTLEEKINGLNIPSIEGLAKSVDLSQEVSNRENADTKLGERIDELATKVNAAPAGGGSSGGDTVHYDIPGVTPTGTFEGIISLRYNGGAGNSGHVDYPADWPKFAVPPAITATSTTISKEDWAAGKMGPGATINITGTSTTGFNFQHPGGWPGNNLESITFWIKGVLA